MKTKFFILIFLLNFNFASYCAEQTKSKFSTEQEYESYLNKVFAKALATKNVEIASFILIEKIFWLSKENGYVYLRFPLSVNLKDELEFADKLMKYLKNLIKNYNFLNLTSVLYIKNTILFVLLESANFKKIKEESKVNFNFIYNKTVILNSAKYAIADLFFSLVTSYTVDLTQTDRRGLTAMHYVVGRQEKIEDRIRILDYLIKYVPNINSVTNRGWTPLHMACAHGNLWAVEKLIEAGADLHLRIKSRFKDKQTDDEDKTAWDLAIEYENKDIQEYIEEVLKLKLGWSPLHVVCAYGDRSEDLSYLKKLIEAGADLNLKTNDNQTALDLAQNYGHKQIVEYLTSLRASWE